VPECLEFEVPWYYKMRAYTYLFTYTYLFSQHFMCGQIDLKIRSYIIATLTASDSRNILFYCLLCPCVYICICVIVLIQHLAASTR